MDKTTREAVIGNCLQEIRTRLGQATSIANIAQTCTDTGQLQKSIDMMFDIEPIIHEVKTLLNAAVLFNRIGKS